MATKGTTAGLLSKVAKFVRHPTKDWSELDKIESESEPEPERGYSKQSLKEMIERKRQNDFVRRREFDELRKLRRNGPVIRTDLAGRPSFFQGTTTTSNLDERAETIKKIDEIEAQMSKQWWKGKQDETTVNGTNFPISGNLPLPASVGTPMTAAPGGGANAFADGSASAAGDAGDGGRNTDFEATQMGMTEPAGVVSTELMPEMMVFKSSASKSPESSISGFTPSKLFSIEMGDSLADTDMEEAAIRFANGDDVGAEAGLLAALKSDNIRPESANGWAAALFDLYRATGQQDSFDRVAIEYAQRFGHSAPAWFSTPDLLGRKTAAAPLEQLAQSAQVTQVVWECPAELDFQALQAMRASLSRSPEPWHLNWSRLKTITPDAGEALADLFSQWCVQPVILHFDGADVLEKIIRSLTPSGDKGVPLFWWRLRLDALRIMRLQDEFELAALDYCVNYEVSPPPWQNAQCQYVSERMNPASRVEDGDELMHGVAVSDFHLQPGEEGTELMEFDAQSAVIELAGEVLGDAAEALDKLQDGLKGAKRLIISCDRLIRVDFSAAGSILNWVAAREAEGCHVQFRDVPRLVAAFFNVIGINEHARVILRTS
ncbi:MAG: STAS domain-containing protein [Rhodoferax sp.]|uniref:STAS domain-containing protein n=1 Tax=Rhodoferax sp. TaxID=50421 RepID=UPI00260E66F7|nr:STAS domain-containing protein [Rhodoferax sp.]MDD5335034.1 STAS domain-containing protein [Rhodoferax sp.]